MSHLAHLFACFVILVAFKSAFAHRTYPPCPDREENPDCEPCMQTCADKRYQKWCPERCPKPHNHCYCQYGYLRNDWGYCVPSYMCGYEDRKKR